MTDEFYNSMRRRLLPLLLMTGVLVWAGQGFAASISQWQGQWPRTDFSRTSVDLSEIRSGGPGKDGIPAIDKPEFISTADMLEKKWLSPREPVIGLVVNGDARAYPLRILMWHEIANDTVGGVPVTITYCPLCNSSIVFDRRIGGRVLDFGVSGNLRFSDMIMYDRQTESWWQQFLGEAIVGELTGTVLKMLPARVESFERFARRAPQGKVMVPSGGHRRAYGRNPYAGYDTARWPMLYQGSVPKGVKPMAYVLAVGKEAWTLDLIRRKKRIETNELLITWEAGQGSALDTSDITQGRDIGNVIVKRRTSSGYVDAIHDLTFAFVFHAFVRDGKLHK